MADDLNKPAPPVAAPRPVVPAPAQAAPVAPPKPKKMVIWDGSWRGTKPTQSDLPSSGVVMAKQVKAPNGTFFYSNGSGKPAFFPNPESYPKGGYFAGEAVPVDG